MEIFRKYKILYVGLIIASALFISGAIAKKGKKRIYTVDFEDEFIEGHVKNPTIFHLFNKQQLEYDKLVDLKKDFLPEMRRTAGELE